MILPSHARTRAWAGKNDVFRAKPGEQFCNPVLAGARAWAGKESFSAPSRKVRIMYENLIAQTRLQIDELEAEAREIAKGHWDYHLRSNHGLPPAKKGKLNAYVRRKGDSLEIHWSKFRFVNSASGGPSTVRSSYLKKGLGTVYPNSVLANAGQNFEIDFAIETEQLFGAIRAEFQSVRKALKYLQQAEKRQAARVKLIEDEEEDVA